MTHEQHNSPQQNPYAPSSDILYQDTGNQQLLRLLGCFAGGLLVIIIVIVVGTIAVARHHRPRGLLQGHAGPLWSAQFSPDGTRIVTASFDGTARIWSVDGEEQVILQGHAKSVRSARFSPDGTRIVTASDDGTARIWGVDAKVLAILASNTSELTDAQFSPDGTRILTFSSFAGFTTIQKICSTTKRVRTNVLVQQCPLG